MLNQSSTTRNFGWSEREAVQRSFQSIEALLERMVAIAGAGNVHVVGHSLGGRGVVEALRGLSWSSRDRPSFDQVILLAPDIDAGTFRGQFPELRSLAKRITLYTSDSDNALKISRRIHRRARLGEAGQDLTVMPDLDTVDISATGAYEISGHLYHLYNPFVIADMRQLLRTGEKAAERPGLRTGTRGGLPYWQIVPPGAEFDRERQNPSSKSYSP